MTGPDGFLPTAVYRLPEDFVQRPARIVGGVGFENFVKLQDVVSGAYVAQEVRRLVPAHVFAVGELLDHNSHQRHQETPRAIFTRTWRMLFHSLLELLAENDGGGSDPSPFFR